MTGLIPTGLKLYIGIAVAAASAAVIGGYTSGGGLTGPISAGYKGGIGDHISYAVLAGVAFVSLIVGGLLTYFRDVDAEEVARAMGTAAVPVGQRPVAASVWPVVTGVGVGFIMVGMAVSAAVTGIGIVIMAIVAFEWTMTAWADRATGDPETNQALRDQLMGPFEIPLLGLLGGGVLVLAASRIFLRFPETGAVIFGAIISIAILGVAIALVYGESLPKGLTTSVAAGLALFLLIFGAWSFATTTHEEEGEEGEEEAAALVEVVQL